MSGEIHRTNGRTSLPYAPGRGTSRRAAESVRARAPSIRARVYDFVLRRGDTGATADEIVAASGHPHHNTIAPRVTELKEDGWLEVIGERVTRAGEMAEVYKAIPGGPGKRTGKESSLREWVRKLERRVAALESRISSQGRLF